MALKRPINALERAHQDLGNQTIPTTDLIINTQNIRNTFLSLSELDNYLAEIGFPEDAFNTDQSPLDWLDDTHSHDPNKHVALSKIVSLALSIKDQGQLQPIGVIKETDKSPRVVFGSTRAMACHILKQKVDIKLLKRSDELQELKQHLEENIKRDDLSFSEMASGYLRLLEALVEAGEIQSISRKSIMDHLGMSRAWASKWNAILQKMLSNSDYDAMVSDDEFGGLTPAYEYLRPKQPVQQSVDVNVETGYVLDEIDTTHDLIDSNEADNYEDEKSIPKADPASAKTNTHTKLAVPLFSGKPTSDTLPLICKIMNHALESELHKMAAENHPNLDAFKSTADRMIPIANLVDANKAADLIRTTLD